MLREVEASWRDLSRHLLGDASQIINLHHMLQTWIALPGLKWGELVYALRAIGHPALADRICSSKVALYCLRAISTKMVIETKIDNTRLPCS